MSKTSPYRVRSSHKGSDADCSEAKTLREKGGVEVDLAELE